MFCFSKMNHGSCGWLVSIMIELNYIKKEPSKRQDTLETNNDVHRIIHEAQYHVDYRGKSVSNIRCAV